MKKLILYSILYFIIIYVVYAVSNFLEIAGGFISFFYTIGFWLLFIILFISIGWKLSYYETYNRISRFFLLLILSLLPIVIAILGYNVNSRICEMRLNDIGGKIEHYYLKNKSYPCTLDEIASPVSRIIKSPFLLLPFPRYYYETDSLRKYYSIHVYEGWDGGQMISSKEKEARWFE